eukprot:scaffold680280_cov64-Prasinocladus_malaysianus.AAC.1
MGYVQSKYLTEVMNSGQSKGQSHHVLAASGRLRFRARWSSISIQTANTSAALWWSKIRTRTPTLAPSRTTTSD